MPTNSRKPALNSPNVGYKSPEGHSAPHQQPGLSRSTNASKAENKDLIKLIIRSEHHIVVRYTRIDSVESLHNNNFILLMCHTTVFLLFEDNLSHCLHISLCPSFFLEICISSFILCWKAWVIIKVSLPLSTISWQGTHSKGQTSTKSHLAYIAIHVHTRATRPTRCNKIVADLYSPCIVLNTSEFLQVNTFLVELVRSGIALWSLHVHVVFTWSYIVMRSLHARVVSCSVYIYICSLVFLTIAF